MYMYITSGAIELLVGISMCYEQESTKLHESLTTEN